MTVSPAISDATVSRETRESPADRGPAQATRRVLHLISSLEMGGAPRYLAELASRQVAGDAIDPVVVVMDDGVNAFHRPVGIEPIFLDGHYRTADLLGLRRLAHRVRHLLDEHEADVLHTHLPPADLVGSLAAAGRVPHVAHLQGTPPWLASSSLRNRLRRGLTRWAFRRSRGRFAAVSSSVRDFYAEHLGLAREHMQVLFNSVEPGDLQAIPLPHEHDGPLTLGLAGRLVEEKGFDRLIAALPGLEAAGHDVQLLIAGTGGRESSWREEAERLGVSERITWLGNVREMRSFYEAIDVFVLPSLHSEGLPLVLLEAMTAGRAIIATDTAGVRDAVVEGHSGVLVPPDDSDALAAAVATLTNETGRRVELAAAARERVLRDFAPATLDARLQQIYDEATAAFAGEPS